MSSRMQAHVYIIGERVRISQSVYRRNLLLRKFLAFPSVRYFSTEAPSVLQNAGVNANRPERDRKVCADQRLQCATLWQRERNKKGRKESDKSDSFVFLNCKDLCPMPWFACGLKHRILRSWRTSVFLYLEKMSLRFVDFSKSPVWAFPRIWNDFSSLWRKSLSFHTAFVINFYQWTGYSRIWNLFPRGAGIYSRFSFPTSICT